MELQKKYYTQLTIEEKQKFIKIIKDGFEKKLGKSLNLMRVSAPIVIDPSTGLQDDLSGSERKVEFELGCDKMTLEVVQSLAKWKRFALKKYSFAVHTGLYTDMLAIRRDEELDETHSVYVDQWDWEKVILKEDRKIEFLKSQVKKIAKAIIECSKLIKSKTSKALPELSEKVFFISSENLLKMYPHLTPKQREYEITKKHKTVFIMQIGEKLSDGKVHDLRAPDYDDWCLNGDLFFYHEVLDIALELSSMGIRVDEKSLLEQLEKANQQKRLKLPYHQKVANKQLPLTIGGGIGQSRLCMLILGRAHIGEVQATYWTKQILAKTKRQKIELL